MSTNILGLFDGGDIGGLTALIDKLEQSSFDYMKLEGDGVRIVIGKNGAAEVSAAAAPAADTAPAKPAEAVAAALAAEAAPAKKAEPVPEAEGVFVVKSPSYGIFYAQPEPGAPPYVQIGDIVKKGNTLGLLEIMKTFNAITSEVDGEVVGIHVQNQEALEPEQPLFSIKLRREA